MVLLTVKVSFLLLLVDIENAERSLRTVAEAAYLFGALGNILCTPASKS